MLNHLACIASSRDFFQGPGCWRKFSFCELSVPPHGVTHHWLFRFKETFLKIKAKFVNLEFWQKHFFFVCDLQALALDHLPRSFDTPVSVRPPLGLGGNPWVRWQRLGLDGNLLLASTWGDPQARSRGHVEIFSSHRAQPYVEVSGFPRLASQLRRHLVTLSGVAFQEFE